MLFYCYVQYFCQYFYVHLFCNRRRDFFKLIFDNSYQRNWITIIGIIIMNRIDASAMSVYREFKLNVINARLF